MKLLLDFFHNRAVLACVLSWFFAQALKVVIGDPAPFHTGLQIGSKEHDDFIRTIVKGHGDLQDIWYGLTVDMRDRSFNDCA